ncbi:uncharacterized protein LOC112341686 [Selaginella moellendorffii]|uniref:uncharacterized protein LOC112341686 n=1 Tax=Selaginella moellendorffii TaxID=88036 RepID=UPI000D1C6EA4|nr:uncharacterized protein LOC112341686 [Selaginella moellendorffii]|eukprot:XP_024518030.1 uncharacterized protein LOC112341686 [Selaginella moellendorffii]
MKRTVSVSSLGGASSGCESPKSVLDYNHHCQQHYHQNPKSITTEAIPCSAPRPAPRANPSSRPVGLGFVVALGEKNEDLCSAVRLTRSSIARAAQQCARPRDKSGSSNSTAPSFLRFCCLCKREIVYGRDIYMYRGIQAFCSLDCRDQQITNDEKQERKNSKPKSSSSGVYSYYKRPNLRTKVAAA